MTTEKSSVKKRMSPNGTHTLYADGVVVAAAVTNTDYHRRRTSMSLAFITYDDERAHDVLEKENEKQQRRNTINYTLVGGSSIFTKIDDDTGRGNNRRRRRYFQKTVSFLSQLREYDVTRFFFFNFFFSNRTDKTEGISHKYCLRQ